VPEANIFEVGDWVRFYRSNALVISRVNYVVTRIGGYVYLLTDVGEVRPQEVVEYKR
jgi:hypothetical protein